MNATIFYQQVAAAMDQPPDVRHAQLVSLHDQALRKYQSALNRLTADQVHEPPPDRSDQRTIAQIIGHIAAWDRFALLAAGDILAGVRHPRMITDLSGYRETDGTFPTFATIAEEFHDEDSPHGHRRGQ